MDKDLSLKIRYHLGSAIAFYQNVLNDAQKLPDDNYDYSCGIGEPQTKESIVRYWENEIESVQSIINELDK